MVAYEALDVAPNIAVRVELANGLVGRGNAAPDEHVTGETADGVERTLSETLKPFLIGKDAARIPRGRLTTVSQIFRRSGLYGPPRFSGGLVWRTGVEGQPVGHLVVLINTDR